jgi:DNA-binding XRE family transcriptional regulator
LRKIFQKSIDIYPKWVYNIIKLPDTGNKEVIFMKKDKITYLNIEAERVRNGLTQADLSDELGVTSRTYINWQRNGGDIPASKLLKMAEIFKCSIDYLLQTTK